MPWCCAALILGVACSTPEADGQPRASPPAPPPVAEATSITTLAPTTTAPAVVRPVAPWLVGFDPIAAKARFDDMPRSASLRCMFDLAAERHEVMGVLDAAADEAPPIVFRALAVAMGEHPNTESSFEPPALAAAELLMRGATEDGRILLEASEARESIFFVEHRAALGMPYPQDGPRKLQIVTELALGGSEDEAARLYDGDAELAAKYALQDQVAALVALGRLDAAAARLAAEPPDRQWLGRMAWVRTALRKRAHLAEAIDGLLEARTARGTDWLQDGIVLAEVVRFGRGLGLGAEVGPVRRRILDEIATVEHGLSSEITLARLADEVLAHDDPEERRLLEPALARSTMNVWKDYVTALVALHHGTLAQTLAAIPTIGTSADIPLYVRLWVRHAVAGLDPTFDAQFVASACPPVPDVPR